MTTPEAWLDILAKRMDADYQRIHTLRGYCTGNAPLPEMGENVRASWEKFQRKARTDFGGLATRSLGNRLRPNGVTIGADPKHPALEVCRRQWRDNRLDVQFADAIRDALHVGVGYLVVGVADGEAVITREAPEQFLAAPDPLRPWRARAALKVWRDPDAGQDFAIVWAPGVQQSFVRSSSFEGSVLRRVHGGWVANGDAVPYSGSVPVFMLEREDARGFIEPHTDLIDRINLGKLDRLVTTAMQAFRQRALRPKDKDSESLPEKDAYGNTIDWAKALEPAPGALWDFPVPIDIWESSPTDIRPLLDAEKGDARDFAAVTGTPISVLIPEGQNQSAEGAATAKEQQVFQAQAEIDRFSPALAGALVRALQAEGVQLEDTLSILWVPPAHVSLSEKYAAASQAKDVQSLRTIQRDILGMSPEQIAQDELDRADEQLSSAVIGNG